MKYVRISIGMQHVEFYTRAAPRILNVGDRTFASEARQKNVRLTPTFGIVGGTQIE